MSINLKSTRSIVTPRLDKITDPALVQVLNDFAKIITTMAQNVYDDLNRVGMSKALNFNYNLTNASGNQSYHGFGFMPRAVIIVAGLDGAKAASWGFSDGLRHLNLESEAITATDQIGMDGANILNLLQAAGASQKAFVKSFDSDGFTLSWTKTGSPTGTVSLYCLAFA